MGFDGSKIDVHHLPEEKGALREIILGLLDERDEQLQEIRRLVHMLEKLLRHRYGPRRERVDPNQLFLFAAEMVSRGQDVLDEKGEEKEKKKSKKERRGKGHGRKRLPGHLAREQVVHALSEKEKTCPDCGGRLQFIGKEVSERLEWVPASLRVMEDVCEKYACPKGCGVVTATKPMQAIEKGLAGPGLLAHVVTNKYADHLPLHRQEAMFDRLGVKLPRSTLCDWMARCAEVVIPLYELMKEQVLESKVMQTDDTPVAVLDRNRTRTRQGYMWTYVGDRHHPYTVYDFTPNRNRDGPLDFMKAYEGYLQADAYAGYNSLFEDKERDVTEVACWAHARRKYYEAQSSDPMRSMVMLAWIRLLYAVEREARELALDAEGRRALRQEKSVPILEDIKAYLEREISNVTPKSPEATAIGYTLSNWEALVRYCEDGDLEIDNNAAERSLRGIVVGRKNWLYFGSDNGGRTAAILTSFTTTCKRLGLDPFAYLRDVFKRISSHPVSRLEELLPDKWQAARQSAEV